jgi:hypothetical protein
VPEQNNKEIRVGGWLIKPEFLAYKMFTLKQLAGHEKTFGFRIDADYARPDSGAHMNDLVIDSVRTRVGGASDPILWSVTSIGFLFYNSGWPVRKSVEVERIDDTSRSKSFEIPPNTDSLIVDFYVTITPGKHALFPTAGYRDMLSDWVVVPEDAVGRHEVITATLVRKESKSLFFGL